MCKGIRCGDLFHYDSKDIEIPRPISDFGSFPKFLLEDQFDVYIAHVATGPKFTPSIEDNAMCLQNQLNKLYFDSQKRISSVDIIAHSMGGLISRAYVFSNTLSSKADHIKIGNLVTLGTPRTGTALGKHACLREWPFAKGVSDIAACQFQSGVLGIDVFNNKYPIKDQPITYTFIGGDRTPINIWFGELLIKDGTHDGVVGAMSGIGAKYLPGEKIFPALIGVGAAKVNRFVTSTSWRK